MKLIIIYGPEASGKLTIAKQLSRKTGFRLFHNHISVDVARSVFDFGTTGFKNLIWDVRHLVFETAAKSQIDGLIFTWAYSHPDFLPYLKNIQAIMEKYDGEIHYVFLSCPIDVLEKRVIQDDRAPVGKIATVEKLRSQMKAKNHVVIPGTNTFVIESGNISPEAAVEQIIRHYNFELK
ncbi:ATP-binding protein [Patescibacteria group bacterium]|nr:ATP-binding protein [Patescibacteria group bacterium]MBU1721802.1 ATP-binding protein [Patescibacteria group bacterium]MBU1900846.1 ATP-binding protein [Patescibacteria group bacterium]